MALHKGRLVLYVSVRSVIMGHVSIWVQRSGMGLVLAFLLCNILSGAMLPLRAKQEWTLVFFFLLLDGN